MEKVYSIAIGSHKTIKKPYVFFFVSFVSFVDDFILCVQSMS